MTTNSLDRAHVVGSACPSAGRRTGRRRARTAVTLLAALTVLATGCGEKTSNTGPSPTQTLDPNSAAGVFAAFAKGWEVAWNPNGKPDQAAKLTDKPATFGPILDDADSDLYVQTVKVTSQDKPRCDGDQCTQQMVVAAQLRGMAPMTWTTTVAAHEVDGTWKIKAESSAIHPDLADGTMFVRRRETPDRAPILDRSGKPLTSMVAVMNVSLDPKTATAATYAAIAKHLDVDAAALRRKAASAKSVIDVITVRATEWTKVSRSFAGVPGVAASPDTQPLAPSAGFARAILGTVRDATPELLASAGMMATPRDRLGASGLQKAFQQQLAGTPGGVIEIRNKNSRRLVKTLSQSNPKPGTPVRTSLDLAYQQAAENAVNRSKLKAHMVVIQASTGRVLAVANGPGTQSYNTSFLGTYAPASTFKAVTALALMQMGMNSNTNLPCPATAGVGGKRFKNDDGIGGGYGNGTLLRAMQLSCNTSFILASERLPTTALTKAARLTGFGQKFDLSLPAVAGKLPSFPTPTDKAAALIGQGEVLASPLQMAVVAAAIANGTARKPVLVLGKDPGGAASTPIPRAQQNELKKMMRATVTSGTARVLAPAGQVGAKTGTAQVMIDGKMTNNGWMMGYRGDLAFAVEVDGGSSGSGSAGPIALQFLRAVR